MTFRRALILLMAVAAFAAATGATAAPAAAAQTPCWKQLLNDWYDGRIDGSYPVRCYREAIRNLPADVDAYTEAREDIERAMLAAVRANGRELESDDVVPPEPPRPAPGGTVSDDDVDGDGIPNEQDDDDGEPSAAPGGGDEDGGLVGFFRPSNADEIPLPLLLLAGLAVLLLAAAAASFAARRLQARRLRPAQVQNPPRPPEP